MSVLTVSKQTEKKTLEVKTVLAFLAIYILWGSTFLAIRMAVLLVPPWLCAGIRFFTAGVLLYFFARVRGAGKPTVREWRSLATIGFLMFTVTYGALFWGEQFVPSGITSVLEATLPLMTVLLEVFVFRQQPFRWRVLLTVLIGFSGVALMVAGNRDGSISVPASLVILGGSLAWCCGAVLTRALPLPKSRVITAGAEMMLGGALLLVLSAARGELRPFPVIPATAAWALAYLIVAGSLIGFTAFVWLLGRMPASKVASHAYVNPVVALALGYFAASEPITPRVLLGAVIVIGSVFMTMRTE